MRYRVSADNAWFYQDVAGRRIARLAAGSIVTAGATRNDWMQVTLEGWIFGTSVGPSDRPDFDLLVTHSPNENLRAAPAGPLIAELAQGFGLKRAGADSAGKGGRWVHVRRDGWVQRSALVPVPDIVATRTVDTSTAANTAAPDGRSSDTTRVDSSRAQPMRVTTLYRAPDGPEAGTISVDTPVRVLSRNGEWTRVQYEGWVKGEDLQVAPAGVMLGVTAAELRAEPQRYVGQVLRWRLEFIALQKADEMRPDIPSGASYALARGPLPERGFVYVVVPDNRLAAFRALTPLVEMQITVRVRNGRSRYLGNPVVDLVSLEGDQRRERRAGGAHPPKAGRDAGRAGLSGPRLHRVPRVEVRAARRGRAGLPKGGGNAGRHHARGARSGDHHSGNHGRGGKGGAVSGRSCRRRQSGRRRSQAQAGGRETRRREAG